MTRDPTAHITDFDDAYANAEHIADAASFPPAWTSSAQEFRDALGERATLDISYGADPREKLDIFMPVTSPRGLVVFVHGGYWKAFDKSFWSHLARGAVDKGMAVAVPSYTLCPDARIGAITVQIARAVETAAAKVEGPIALAGHSAGGHLVSRMICENTPLDDAVSSRIKNVVSISGVHDLRPLLKTKINQILKLDATEANDESPALLQPRSNARVVCWVGADELSEFVRQNSLLAERWRDAGASTAVVEEHGRHHFNVIDALGDPDHTMIRALLSPLFPT